MSDISINISSSIESDRVAVLRSIQEVAQELGIHFIAVGAFARDLIFEHFHRIPAPRLTEDIDIGVEVASWEDFHRLTSILIDRGLFAATRAASIHRRNQCRHRRYRTLWKDKR